MAVTINFHTATPSMPRPDLWTLRGADSNYRAVRSVLEIRTVQPHDDPVVQPLHFAGSILALRHILNPGAVLIEGAKEFLILQPPSAAMLRKHRRDYTAVHISPPGIGIATLQPHGERAFFHERCLGKNQGHGDTNIP